MAAAADMGRLQKRITSLERKNGNLANKVAAQKVTITQLKGTVGRQRSALNRVAETARRAAIRDDPAAMAQAMERERLAGIRIMERERLAGIRMENERQEMERQRERVQRLDEQERIRVHREREELQYLKERYEARMRGDAPPLPPKRVCGVTNFPIPMADYR